MGAERAPQGGRREPGRAAPASLKPIDFSDVFATQAQIKKMFRDIEMRGTWMHRQQKKNNNEYVKNLLRDKRAETASFDRKPRRIRAA